MAVPVAPALARSPRPFSHEAWLYDGTEAFVSGAAAFVEEGVAAGEPVLVAVPAERGELLRDALDGAAEQVRFIDMTEVGRNPSRLIPLWREFVDEATAGGQPARGIGEPVWAARSAAELVECQRHEALLNLAFAAARDFRLLCPYASTLGPRVLAEARRSHPVLLDRGIQRPSPSYPRPEAGVPRLGDPLPEPPVVDDERVFGADLAPVRAAVAASARSAWLPAERVMDLVVAVNELATNSVVHGGGKGRLRLWLERNALVCEVSDSGTITDPLVGRHAPTFDQIGGRGLWLANQLCDLVELRSAPEGTVVRCRIRRS